MIFLQLLLTSPSFADDSLDKKVFLLRRAIKNEDCNQASEMIEKLLLENPSYTDFWKVKAEVDDCLGVDDTLIYSSYEKYLELGGSRDDVSIAMGEIEENLLSVRIEITTDTGPVTDWSKIDVSLKSDRFIKEEDGVYLLKYTEPKEYNLSITSTSPLIESVEKTFTGTGFQSHSIVLHSFEPSTLTIPSYEKGLSLEVFPANSRDKSILGKKTGDIEVGAGLAKVVANYKGESVAYETEIFSGNSTLELPWMYSINYDGKALHTEILPPEEIVVNEEGFSVKSPFEGTDELLVTFSVEQKLGEHQVLTLRKETFEETDLYKELQNYEKKYQVSQTADKKKKLMLLGSGTGFVAAGGVQFLALQDASAANAITAESKYDEFQSLSDAAYGRQKVAMALGGIGIAALGTVFYFGSSTDMDEELSEIEKRIDELKNESIIIE